jgi:hypothetical protein
MREVEKGQELLKKESDRGCVLIAGAMADEFLGELLRSVFVGEHIHDSLLGDGPSCPLGSFSARIKICRALGMLHDDDHHDLEILRRLRNEAAHFERGKGFSTGFVAPSVAERCRMFTRASTADPGTTPRTVFLLSIGYLLGYLASLSYIARYIADNLSKELALDIVVGARQGVTFYEDGQVKAYYDRAQEKWFDGPHIPATILAKLSRDYRKRVARAVERNAT